MRGKAEKNMRFRIEYISTGSPPYVLARQLESGDFVISADSFLGGARIKLPLSQPRSLNPDGSPVLIVFAFHLHEASEASVLKVGATVSLTSATVA